MYSMTGYGKGEYRGEGITLTAEIKSVNNRYLDISLKCPHAFASYEEVIRSLIREKISRGHLDVYVSFTDKREKEQNLYLDVAAANAYVKNAQALSEATGVKNDITVSFLLRQPDILRPEEAAQSADEQLKNALTVALTVALDNLMKMRLAEGERLKTDLLARMDTIAALREQISERAPLVSENYRIKLTERMQDFLDGKADENRILLEAALFADKCNIDEELTRLASHIEEFKNICKSDIAGRKLDFLTQEFNRECNTVCSKSNDGALTKIALEMKCEIEKVREQIQNLE